MIARIVLPTFAILFLALITSAQRIDKPPLVQNFGYLTQGLLNNLHAPSSSVDAWGPGWIPQHCRDWVKYGGYDEKDITTYNIHYSDCEQPWVVCQHKDTKLSLNTMVDLFGKLPVLVRSHVKHVVNLPTKTNGYAFSQDGSIALFGIDDDGIAVFIHEAGHCIDLNGGYAGRILSSSQDWDDAINADSNVPDPYSGTNMVEDVAQNTVLAVYDVVVPGGYGVLEPNWRNVYHQYGTLKQWADDSGKLLQPEGQCRWRSANSETVAANGSGAGKRRMRMAREQLMGKPDVSLKEGIEELPTKHFSTKGSCGAI
ncbi:MAG: hypothetical protein LQ350_008677 [Teloschistes chrysophthalmus]|nr:MAG: hypothetical protein LQ350_008677 [Niorma chrysophthalma]